MELNESDTEIIDTHMSDENEAEQTPDHPGSQPGPSNALIPNGHGSSASKLPHIYPHHLLEEAKLVRISVQFERFKIRIRRLWISRLKTKW